MFKIDGISVCSYVVLEFFFVKSASASVYFFAVCVLVLFDVVYFVCFIDCFVYEVMMNL